MMKQELQLARMQARVQERLRELGREREKKA